MDKILPREKWDVRWSVKPAEREGNWFFIRNEYFPFLPLSLSPFFELVSGEKSANEISSRFFDSPPFSTRNYTASNFSQPGVSSSSSGTVSGRKRVI